MSRIEELKDLKKIVWDSISEAPAEKRGPLVAQYRAILQEIEAGSDPQQGEDRSGLIDFQEALDKRRQSAAKNSR